MGFCPKMFPLTLPFSPRLRQLSAAGFATVQSSAVGVEAVLEALHAFAFRRTAAVLDEKKLMHPGFLWRMCTCVFCPVYNHV